MGDANVIDPLLRVGQFIIFLIGIGTILWKLSAMMTRFEMHGEKIEKIEAGFTKMSEALTTLAVQKNTLENQGALIVALQKDVDGLRRGEGFIQRRSAVDGQYP